MKKALKESPIRTKYKPDVEKDAGALWMDVSWCSPSIMRAILSNKLKMH